MRVLSGDLGGTKTLLRLSEVDPARPESQQVVREMRFESLAYPGLAEMAQDFLDAEPGARSGLNAACFGVAGPVTGDARHQRARLTNLPWALDSDQLAAALGLASVRLINDFQALGYGIEALAPADLVPLQEAPAEPQAPRVVLGAGTGLGVALLLPAALHYEVWPTEGGHVDFGPTDPLQDRLLGFLRGLYGRVSYERVVSGPGLVDIYRFLLAEANGRPEEDALLTQGDPAAAISAAAESGPGSPASQALELFTAVYGAFAGNLALGCLATGGVYVAGGIAPKILARLKKGTFMTHFLDKGRMRPLVERMPVQVVTNQQTGLLGATLAASRLSPESSSI